MNAPASAVAIAAGTHLTLDRAAPSLAAYANTLAGIIKFGDYWHACLNGEIDTARGFSDRLEALDWLRVLIRDDMAGRHVKVPA